jgi:two-component system chemotaxis response regulator CheY
MDASRPLRFLVVGSVASMRQLLRDLLKDIGQLDAEEADTGPAALVRLRESPFDFVIHDLDMPSSDALALLRSIRADDALARLPVLLVAERATRDDVLDAVKAGASGCVVKPFTRATLEAKVVRIVQRLSAVA